MNDVMYQPWWDRLPDHRRREFVERVRNGSLDDPDFVRRAASRGFPLIVTQMASNPEGGVGHPTFPGDFSAFVRSTRDFNED